MDSCDSIDAERIDDFVDVLKSVMGIRMVPKKEHPLYLHFEDYERARGLLLPLSNPSDRVYELAWYGFLLDCFREQWKES
jgi:hypothetical protein